MDPATLAALFTGFGGLIAAILTAFSSASKTQVASLQATIQSLTKENERLRGRQGELEEAIALYQQRISDLAATVDSYRARIEELEAKLEHARRDHNANEAELERLREENQALKREIARLREFIESRGLVIRVADTAESDDLPLTTNH